MTRIHCIGPIICAVSLFAAGCAGVDGRAERSPQADKVAVHETVPPGARAFRLVRRVWTQTGRSAFTVPRYASTEDGAADLQNQAVALGGDAIMNFGCYRADPSIPFESRPRMICNGNVIKYVQ